MFDWGAGRSSDNNNETVAPAGPHQFYGRFSQPPDNADDLDARRSGEGVRAVCGGAVRGEAAREDESADGLLF